MILSNIWQGSVVVVVVAVIAVAVDKTRCIWIELDLCVCGNSVGIGMAPTPAAPKNSGSYSKKSPANLLKILQKDYMNIGYAKSLLFDPAKLPIVSVGILAIELILNIFIVQRVNYTEIDWIAYMQECEGFLNGTTNYSQLKGIHNLILFLFFSFAFVRLLVFNIAFAFIALNQFQVIQDHWFIRPDSCTSIQYSTI